MFISDTVLIHADVSYCILQIVAAEFQKIERILIALDNHNRNDNKYIAQLSQRGRATLHVCQ